MRTKIDIISGFLGAGKTTLIKKLLDNKVDNQKIVIIENEFGEVGIDGKLMKDSGFHIKEINSGCICCSLIGDFEKAIEEIIDEFDPNRIIIEPSGVGKLSEIIKACKSDKLEKLTQINMLITVVDTDRFSLYLSNFGEFYEDQIKSARTVLLSRTQNVSQEKIEFVVNEVQRINNRCNIVTTPWDDLKTEIIANLAEENLKNAKGRHNRKVKDVKRKSKRSNTSKVFKSWGMETPKIFSKEKLEDVLRGFDSNRKAGNILRAKGIVQIENGKWIQFNYVLGDFEIKEILPNYTGKLSIIGTNLNEDILKKIFDNIM